jgi:copper transport protein
VLAALAVALGVFAPGAAAAHAVLVATAPADRAVIGDAPPQLSLRFNEPVEPVAVRLIDGAGHAVAAEVTAANETVRVVPAAPLAGGAYIVSWRVISADAHPVSGAFQFAVGGEPRSWRTAPEATGKGALWFAIAVANRALNLIALALALGGALYGVLIGAAPRRVVLWGAGVAAVTALLAVGFEGGLVLEVPLARLLDPEIWRVGAGTSRGIASAVAVLGLAALMARQAVAGATLVVASFALSGHVATAPPRILAVPALLIHAGIALIWLGAFVPLLRAAPGEGGRFGRLARWAVRGLVLAGLVIAAIQVREWSPLVQTAYGVILLVKAALVAALIFLVAECVPGPAAPARSRARWRWAAPSWRRRRS